MVPLEPDWLSLLRLPVAAALFLLPGWLLGRCLGTPFPALTAFLGSAVLFCNSVLLLDAVGVPLQAGSLGLVVVLWSLLLGGRAWRQRAAAPPPAAARAPATPAGAEWLWLLPVGVALASIALRAVVDPLSGYDNVTRWDFLARLVLAQGSLAHYPPVSAEDFLWYNWCDGIPPLVPLLNLWIYAACGSVAPALTVARVVGEACLLGVATFLLARRLWGAQAGWPALAALATSALLLWACASGQETGMTALSLTALVLFLEEHRAGGGPRCALWAGVAAGVGGISREYGLAFILLGGLVLLVRRADRRALLHYAVAAGVAAAPWYARNWVLTGNPVFPHALGGIFPTNPIHLEVMRAIAGFSGLDGGFYSPRYIPVVLAVLAGPLALLGAIGAVRAGQRAWVPVLGVVLVIGLWFWAIPSTAGGWTYAHRVLAPALALAGALAGWLVVLPRAARLAGMLLLTALSLDAARRSWMLPAQSLLPAWPLAMEPWRRTRDLSVQLRGQTAGVWASLIREARGQDIVVDHPAHHAEITMQGGRAAPWFSPKVRALFAGDRPFEDIRRELRANGVRFITVAPESPMSVRFCTVFPFLRELTTAREPSARFQGMRIYDLELLATPSPETPAPVSP